MIKINFDDLDKLNMSLGLNIIFGGIVLFIGSILALGGTLSKFSEFIGLCNIGAYAGAFFFFIGMVFFFIGYLNFTEKNSKK